MFLERCPACGTKGKMWNEDPEVFVCPRCSTYFSKFGVLMDAHTDGETEGNPSNMLLS